MSIDHDSTTEHAASPGTDVATTNGVGLITRPREHALPPALIAEQQRAKSEIEAALTIAAARPRDEKRAMDGILLACQRPGLAAKAQYQYARGGTDITGPSIDLMEVIAQKWGNLEYGFRELARYPGTAGQPGESVVEAFAWDLETNTRRRTQFTVSHSERTKKGLRVLTDPRDVYEWVANQAQRRVRTCLENVVPRDVVDAACEECDSTLKTTVKLTPELIAQWVSAFARFGVTKDAIEARIQRRIDTITAAQMVGLRKIFQSLQDGMSRPEDWFAVAQPEKAASPMDAAKAALRKTPEPSPDPAPPEPESTEQQASDLFGGSPDPDPVAIYAAEFAEILRSAETIADCAAAWDTLLESKPTEAQKAACKRLLDAHTAGLAQGRKRK